MYRLGLGAVSLMKKIFVTFIYLHMLALNGPFVRSFRETNI